MSCIHRQSGQYIGSAIRAAALCAVILLAACAPERANLVAPTAVEISEVVLPTALPGSTPTLVPTPVPTMTSTPTRAGTSAKTATPISTSTRSAALPAATSIPIAITAATGTAVQSVPPVSKNGTALVAISSRPTKINQLIGDYDAERQQPTLGRTYSRFKLESTDLGVPFTHKGRTYVLFGDSFGANGGDAIGYTTATSLDQGLALDFIQDATGAYKPIIIPGISQGGFEVPTEGVSVGGAMYIYHTTDASMGPQGQVMGRSIVATSTDDGQTFRYLYDLSRQSFINVSIVTVDAAQWQGLPLKSGQGLAMFGSGDYRRSNVSLAFQPSAEIGTPSSIRYFAGLDTSGSPNWSSREQDARPLFNQPCVGEFSVSFNRFIGKWIMLYNCGSPRGINMRTADRPWGPWTEPVVLFDPWADSGYCHYMHVAWSFQRCDSVHGPGQEQLWGGEYGPYQFEDLAVGTNTSTTIYFTMSTWNPYTVVLMKTALRLTP